MFNYADEMKVDMMFILADAYEEEQAALEEIAEWEAYEEDMKIIGANEEELKNRIFMALNAINEGYMDIVADILKGDIA